MSQHPAGAGAPPPPPLVREPAALPRLLAVLCLGELAFGALLIWRGLPAPLAGPPVLIGAFYLGVLVGRWRGLPLPRWTTTAPLLAGLVHTGTIAVFLLMLTRFLGPVRTEEDFRVRGVVVLVIGAVIGLAVATLATLALRWRFRRRLPRNTQSDISN